MGHLSVLPPLLHYPYQRPPLTPIKVQDFKVQDLVLTASPRSTLVALELEAIITANNGPDSLGYTMDLPRVAIPGLGISIPDIMNIGAALTYSIGGNCSFSGSATVDFGLQADVPDSAKIVADYKNHGASEATGFTGGQLTPMFGIKNESTSVTLSAYSQLGVDFGVDLFKLGTVSVAVTVKLPEISATLTAKYGKYFLIHTQCTKTRLTSWSRRTGRLQS